MPECLRANSQQASWERITHLSFGRPFLYIATVLAVSTLSGCASTPASTGFPATSNPTTSHIPGKIVWHDLLTSDVPAAREIYGQLFDWSFEGNGRYTVLTHGGQRIGGIVDVVSPSGEPRTPRWIMSLSVSDVDQATAFVQSSGGKVHEGPGVLKGRGRAALVSDPQGAQLALLKADGGDPEDSPAQDSTWLWHELWTDNADDAIAFYSGLAGYTDTEMLEDYHVLRTDNRWRAGVRAIFDEKLERRWVPVIRVDDAKAIAAKASRLGGRILLPVDQDATALLADPGGALFMVQEWNGKDQLPGRDES